MKTIISMFCFCILCFIAGYCCCLISGERITVWVVEPDTPIKVPEYKWKDPLLDRQANEFMDRFKKEAKY